MNPRSNPKVSSTTFTTGTRQLVVHDAFDRTWCLVGSYAWWFTPITMVRSSFLAGALMMTFLAPALRGAAALSRSVKRPVDSSTMSTPKSFHGSCAGSLADNTRTDFPLTQMPSLSASAVPWNRPWTESYLNRCARVLGSVTSFTATTSRLVLAWTMLRSTSRPIRPNPLIAIFTAIGCVLYRRWSSDAALERERASERYGSDVGPSILGQCLGGGDQRRAGGQHVVHYNNSARRPPSRFCRQAVRRWCGRERPSHIRQALLRRQRGL